QHPGQQDPADRAASALQRLMPGATAPEDPTPPPAPLARALPPVDEAPRLHGSVQARYRLRRSDLDRDQDLSLSTTLDYGDAEKHATTARFAGRGFADLDGIQSDNSFNGLDESFDDRVNGYVYEAYADFHRIDDVGLARLGRQPLYDTPEVIEFDGARVDSERIGSARGWGSIYGGLPVRQWEASRHGDGIFGLAGGLQPWDQGRVRFDWMRIQDETLTFDGSDDLLSTMWWQGLGEHGSLHGKHTWLDGKPRDLLLRHNGNFDLLALSSTVTYRELLTAQRDQVTDFDPYNPILLTYEPFRQLEVLLSTQLDEQWSLSAGCDLRRLRDDASEGQYNHEYTRAYVGPSVQDLFGEDLVLSVQAEAWDASDSDYHTVSGDLRWRLSEPLIATLGSSYARYAYDQFAGEERDHVRDWFVRFQYRPKPSMRVDAAVEYEDNDFDSYMHLRLSTTWTF
ncbi:MAG: hypothetical protein ABL997_05570, partial [Planctomycetota bacterium]